jgi:hypothetical protein
MIRDICASSNFAIAAGLTIDSILHFGETTLSSENHLMSSKLGAGEPSSFVPRSS